MISIRKSLLPIVFGIISIVVAAALVSCPATTPPPAEEPGLPTLSIDDADVTTAAATTTFMIDSTAALTTATEVRLNITAVAGSTTTSDTNGFAVTATSPAMIAAASGNPSGYTHVLTWGSTTATMVSLTVASVVDDDATNEMVTVTLVAHTGYGISGTTADTNITIAVLDVNSISLSIAASEATLEDEPASGMESSTITITADRADTVARTVRLLVTYGGTTQYFPESLSSTGSATAFDRTDVTLAGLTSTASTASDRANHTIELPANMTTATFTVTSSDADSIGDSVTDPVLTFALTTLGDAGYSIGSPATATVTIDADM